MYEYGDTKSKYQSIEEVAMTVRIEKKGKVWTVIHSRPQARNAMDPESADALVEAFTAFDRDADAAAAHRRHGARARDHPHRAQGAGGGIPAHRRLRARRRGWRIAPVCRGDGA